MGPRKGWGGLAFNEAYLNAYYLLSRQGVLVLSMECYLCQSGEVGFKVLTPFPATAILGLMSKVWLL